jgi:hypothetical protein
MANMNKYKLIYKKHKTGEIKEMVLEAEDLIIAINQFEEKSELEYQSNELLSAGPAEE